jgi:L-threonylcarbamoyladenylate synthase
MSEPRRSDLGALAPADWPALAAEVERARLVCLPTDTVYGLAGACRPQTAAAIVAAKGREPGRPLQLVFPSVDVLVAALDPPPALGEAVRRLLPGPFTLVVPYPPGLGYPPPGELKVPVRQASGGETTQTVATLGVRVPRWPDHARPLAALGFPLLASSANPSGRPAPSTLAEVDPGVLAACDLMLDGGRAAGVASVVVDLTRYEQDGLWRVLRAGAVDEKGIREMLTGERGDRQIP